MRNIVDKSELNLVQQAAVELIQIDMRFLYTLVMNRKNIMPTYWLGLSPYIGLIIDGAEDWLKTYNNSSKVKIDIPQFNDEQEHYYEKLRSASKMWDYGLIELYDLLNERYSESESYFGGLCNEIAKNMHLYDTMGVFFIDDYHCGNTILDACYIPNFNIYAPDGDIITKMAEFAGRYISLFGINEGYSAVSQKYTQKDYGGFVKIPFGNDFSIKHVLFACLCTINFVLYGIEKIITEEVPTKLRIEYICYYYINCMLEQIRSGYDINISVSNHYISREFRNSMAHYKLGVALKSEELIILDPLKGLTQKFFRTDYATVKDYVLNELSTAAESIELYLGLRMK